MIHLSSQPPHFSTAIIGGSVSGSRCGPGLNMVSVGVKAGTHGCQAYGVFMWALVVRVLASCWCCSVGRVCISDNVGPKAAWSSAVGSEGGEAGILKVNHCSPSHASGK